MSKKTISQCMKAAILLLGVTGIICCAMMGRIIDYMLPGFSPMTHRLWLYVLYLCAVPCFLSLVPAWLTAGNIGKNHSFCLQNAKYMKLIGCLTLFVAAALGIGNIIYYCIGRSFFAFFLACFLPVAVFGTAAVCAFALSALLKNATELQDQSDWTI